MKKSKRAISFFISIMFIMLSTTTHTVYAYSHNYLSESLTINKNTLVCEYEINLLSPTTRTTYTCSHNKTVTTNSSLTITRAEASISVPAHAGNAVRIAVYGTYLTSNGSINSYEVDSGTKTTYAAAGFDVTGAGQILTAYARVAYC